jgi:predicted nucleic acid-binding protein
MKLVVDANILIAAAKRDGLTRQLLRELDDLYSSPTAIQELRRYVVAYPQDILERVQLVPEDLLLTTIDEADAIISAIDPDDAHLFACALALPGSVIWANDRDLKRQLHVPVLTTSELLIVLRDR